MESKLRRSIRLGTHDYRGHGPYFLTLCSFQKACTFGSIVAGTVHLTAVGHIIQQEWLRAPRIRPEVKLDEFVVMPNHIHAIVFLDEDAQRFDLEPGNFHRTPRSLGSLVAGFKSVCTTRVNIMNHTAGKPLWQRNYYEHVIRSQRELERVRTYVRGNPERWLSNH